MPFLKVSISFFIQKRENEEKDIVLLQLSITGCIFPAIAICLLRIHLPMILSARIIPFIFLLRLICLHLKKYFLLMRMLQDHRRSKYLSSLDYANYLTTLILCEIYQQYISQMQLRQQNRKISVCC